MKLIVEEEYLSVSGICRECGSGVARYTCGPALIKQRPEGEYMDWWASCYNEDCTNHYGEGYFQMPLSWIKYDWQES